MYIPDYAQSTNFVSELTDEQEKEREQKTPEILRKFRQNTDDDPNLITIVQPQGKVIILNHESGKVLIGNNQEEYQVFERWQKYFPAEYNDGSFKHQNIVNFQLISRETRFFMTKPQISSVIKQVKDIKEFKHWTEINDLIKNGMRFLFIEDLVQLEFSKLIQNEEFTKSQYKQMMLYDLEYQALQGLEFLHSHQITHFDIKPQNFQIYPTGQLVYIDFNISKFIGDVLRKNQGTPDYMAPEMKANNNEIVTPLADMYAIYETFEKEAKFRGWDTISYSQQQNRYAPFQEMHFMDGLTLNVGPSKVTMHGFPEFAKEYRLTEEIDKEQANNTSDNITKYINNMKIICQKWINLFQSEKIAYYNKAKENQARIESEIYLKFQKLSRDVEDYKKEINIEIYKLIKKVMNAESKSEYVIAFPDPTAKR